MSAKDEIERLLNEAEPRPRATPSHVAPEPVELVSRLAELAELSDIDYEQIRKSEADKLGFRASALDEIIKKRRSAAGKSNGSGSELVFESVEPWPEPVDGDALVNEIEGCFERHVVLPTGGTTAGALFAIYTHVHDAFPISPLLVATSPEMRCGKTTFLKVCSKLVNRPLASSSLTGAGVFRTIEKWGPTLIIDEADAFLHDNEEMRGILDSGHDRETAYVIRVVGEEMEPKTFSTWAPKIVGHIGKMPSTLTDRAIDLPMKRKTASEKVKSMRGVDFKDVKRRIRRFVDDHMAGLRAANPDMPSALNDRQADNWLPLVAIADAAGPRSATKARDAIEALTGKDEAEASSTGTMLLVDIGLILKDWPDEEISTMDLLKNLVTMAERPWPTYARGRELTPRQLSRLLRPFGVHSRQVWSGSDAGGSNFRGYRKSDFDDALARYTPYLSARVLDANNHVDSSTYLSAREEMALADNQPLEPAPHKDSSALADGKGDTGRAEALEGAPQSGECEPEPPISADAKQLQDDPYDMSDYA
ncbi:MAG: DUF3631 domain-containing protein [Candidatus Eremiobacteraeota bacterium]|nr:DUF3631 domain-containing protein [Candidatus Eremiobacteraeota bacterium]MBC5826121.1 DUF3631 domain-containing protein [Candidatus Eremiobacteraeota bacterium]